MKINSTNLFYFLLPIFILSSCTNFKKLITDEVVMKDGNSQTGTIIQSDSTNIKLKKIDESINNIPWSSVEIVQGKKFKTLFLGANVGFYKTPYFSVFRNEPITARHAGMQYKIGIAARGIKLYYLNLSYSPAKPYAITKFGFGYQLYLGNSTYLKKNSFFIGTEFNLMGVKYNNGAQFAIEPFTGFEKKCNEHFRLHFKLALQLNFANKNNQTGVNATIGAHFMKRNFKKHYEILNQEHRLSRR